MVAERPKVSKSGGTQRQGKGFSSGELKKAGLSMSEAVRLHVPVDPRRKTVHEENVDQVKAFCEHAQSARQSKKPKGKSKS